jgi:hypothetical protein
VTAPSLNALPTTKGHNRAKNTKEGDLAAGIHLPGVIVMNKKPDTSGGQISDFASYHGDAIDRTMLGNPS